MVRSCPAARPERAEQWSRSADGAAEGTTSRSVSLAELLGLLRPQTLSLHIQWRVRGQEREEMEGNSQHAIIKWSPLFWWQKQWDTVRLHPEYIITFSDYSEVISVGQHAAGDNQFMGQWFTFLHNCSLLLHKSKWLVCLTAELVPWVHYHALFMAMVTLTSGYEWHFERKKIKSDLLLE